MAYDLETPGVDNRASKALLQACKLFPETTGFIIVIQVRYGKDDPRIGYEDTEGD
jgi:hypothetical protein